MCLTNVPTLENSALTPFFFFVFFVKTSFSLLAWVRRTSRVAVDFYVLCHGVPPDESCGNARVLGNFAVGQQHGIWRTLCWNDTVNISMSLRELSVGARPFASVDTPCEKCSQVLRCAVSVILCVFFVFPLKGGFYLHSCCQLRTCLADRRSARLAVLSIFFVAPLRSGCEITGGLLRTWKIVIEFLPSDRFTQTSHCSYSCRTPCLPSPLIPSLTLQGTMEDLLEGLPFKGREEG